VSRSGNSTAPRLSTRPEGPSESVGPGREGRAARIRESCDPLTPPGGASVRLVLPCALPQLGIWGLPSFPGHSGPSLSWTGAGQDRAVGKPLAARLVLCVLVVALPPRISSRSLRGVSGVVESRCSLASGRPSGQLSWRVELRSWTSGLGDRGTRRECRGTPTRTPGYAQRGDSRDSWRATDSGTDRRAVAATAMMGINNIYESDDHLRLPTHAHAHMHVRPSVSSQRASKASGACLGRARVSTTRRRRLDSMSP